MKHYLLDTSAFMAIAANIACELMWPILLFMLVVMALGSTFYKRTLD